MMCDARALCDEKEMDMKSSGPVRVWLLEAAAPGAIEAKENSRVKRLFAAFNNKEY
ncbi:MAG: hypothetical protein QM783_13245 [Phycisphaerales bacterium]